MRKKIIIIAVILALIASVSMFLPSVLTQTFWLNEGYGAWHSTWEKDGSAFTSGSSLPYITLGGLLFSALMLVIDLLGVKINPYLSPSLCAVSLYTLIRTLRNTRSSMDKSYLEYTANWGFYLIVVLGVVFILLTILLTLNVFKDEPAKHSMPKSTGTVQQLKELKELLDSGIITQDEFDEKKKILLARL